MSTANVEPNGAHAPFHSLADLKEVHTKLLRSFKDGETEVLDDVESFIRQASAAGAVLDSDNERYASQSILDYWMTVLYRAKRTPPDATLAEFDPALSPKLDDNLCPYRGLNAFQEEDKDLYYGRSRLIKLLLEKLKTTRLLFLVGPSGSGKSSLTLAGLIPTLKADGLDGSKQWQYFPPIVPGRNPLKNLATAIRNSNQPSEWVPQQIEALKQDRQHLLKTLARFSPEPAVIVVDQFEEVFTLCTSDEIRNAFIDNLLSLTQGPESRHIVILTMRTDFESYLVLSPTLTSKFEEGQVRITPLTATDLRDAIEEPARRIGLKFEDGVVDALVGDILGEPEGLPLLQFTLLQLWKTREDKRGRITLNQYRKLGSALRALALTADDLYNKSLTNAEQVTFKRIMLRLALPSGSLEVTRNTVTRGNLYFEDPARVNHVLDKLHKAGLVRITKGDTEVNDKVEVAHEALVRHWPTLVDWIEKERVTLRQRLRLSSAAEQWIEHKRDEGGLLGGSLLEEALKYEDLNELEREFVAASEAAIERAEQEKEDARQRERKLDEERLLALQQKNEQITKNATRLRHFLFILIPLTVIFVITALAAIGQGWRASASERLATEKGQQAEAARQQAEKARQQAETDKSYATEQRALAERRGAELEDREKALNKALTEAVTAKKRAEIESLRAKEQAKLAAARLIDANRERQNALLAKQFAEEQKQRADEYSLRLEKINENQKQVAALTARKIEFTETRKKADSFLARGEIDKAQEFYLKLLDFRDIIQLEGEEDVLSKLSLVYRMSGDKEKRRGDKINADLYYDKAKKQFEAAEKIIKGNITTASAAEVIKSRLKLAQFYLEHNKVRQAETEYLEVLSKQEAVITNGYSSEYANFENLVELVRVFYSNRQEPDLDGLERLYKRVLETKLRVFPDKNNREVYAAYKALAIFYREIGSDDEAEQPYLDALGVAETAIKTRPSETDDVLPYVLDGQLNLGDLYVKLEEYQKAEKYYEQAMLTLNRLKAKDKPQLIALYIKLAEVLRAQGKDNEALKNYDNAMTEIPGEAGEQVRALATSLTGAGEIYQAKGEYKKAQENYLRAIGLLKKVDAQGADAALIQNYLSLAGINYIYAKQSTASSDAAKNVEEGDKLLESALSVPARVLEVAEGNLKPSYIEELYRSALERMINRIKDGDRGQIRTTEALFQRLVRLYRSKGERDKLQVVYSQGMGVLDGIDFISLYRSLWSDYDRQGHSTEGSGKYSDAENNYKKALAIGEGPLGKEESNHALMSYQDLTSFYVRRQRYEDAEAYFLRARAFLDKRGEGRSSKVIWVLENYARLLRKMPGRVADADKLDEEANKIRGK